VTAAGARRWVGWRLATGLVALLAFLQTPAARAANAVGALGSVGGAEGVDDEVQHLSRQVVSLGVSEVEVSQLIRGCREVGFTGAEIQRVLRLVAGAKLGGLPHFNLLNKLREGLAKGVSPDAIQAALGKQAQSLRKAKGIVDSLIMEGWAAPDYPMAVQMVSDALEAGASPSEILCAVRDGTPCGEGVADVRRAFRPPEVRK